MPQEPLLFSLFLWSLSTFFSLTFFFARYDLLNRIELHIVQLERFEVVGVCRLCFKLYNILRNLVNMILFLRPGSLSSPFIFDLNDFRMRI